MPSKSTYSRFFKFCSSLLNFTHIKQPLRSILFPDLYKYQQPQTTPAEKNSWELNRLDNPVICIEMLHLNIPEIFRVEKQEKREPEKFRLGRDIIIMKDICITETSHGLTDRIQDLRMNAQTYVKNHCLFFKQFKTSCSTCFYLL